MYKITATVAGHTACLHDDTVSNGKVKVIEPKLVLEDSVAGSLTFKLAPNNIGYSEVSIDEEMVVSVDGSGNVTKRTVTKTYDMVARMQSTIKVYRNGTEIWEGRVLSEDKDFQNLRNIYCEGELAYLNDTIQPQRAYAFQETLTTAVRKFIEAILSIHNSKVDSSKRFVVGSVTVNNNASTYDFKRATEFSKTIEALNSLVADFSGHLRVRKEVVNGNIVRYLDFLADYPNVSSQQIKFGTNLLDFTCNWDMSDLCTVALPTGAVTEEAHSSSIGDAITPLNAGGVPTTGQFLYINPDTNTVDLKQDPSLGGYRTAEYVVEEHKNYYISCRLHGGLVAYAMYKLEGGVYNIISYKTAGSSGDIGFTDFVDQKEEMPAGVNRLIVCGWAEDIPVTVKNEVEEETGFDQYLTIENCPNDGDWHKQGSPYIINQEMVSKYGWIEKQLPFSDVTTDSELYASAKAYLSDGQFDKMTIEVSAIDLNMLGVNVDAINLLDKVRVISEPHNLNKLFPVTKLEIPLNDPAGQKFTIGSKTEQSLSSVNNTTNDELFTMISNLPAVSSTLNAAKANAAAMINSATNGYITMVNDEYGNPKELVISDEKDYTLARNVWVWNINGLCHSSTGYHADMVDAAITMDGGIVANYITTGTLEGINIIAGGAGAESGTILVRAETNPGYCVVLRDGGVYFGWRDENGNVEEFASLKDSTLYETPTGTLYYSNDSMFDTRPEWVANRFYSKSGDTYTLTTSQPQDWANNWGDYYTRWTRGLVLDADTLALDVNHLWVSDKGGSQDVADGLNETITLAVMDGQGGIYGRDFKFKHGILV